MSKDSDSSSVCRLNTGDLESNVAQQQANTIWHRRWQKYLAAAIVGILVGCVIGVCGLICTTSVRRVRTDETPVKFHDVDTHNYKFLVPSQVYDEQQIKPAFLADSAELQYAVYNVNEQCIIYTFMNNKLFDKVTFAGYNDQEGVAEFIRHYIKDGRRHQKL